MSYSGKKPRSQSKDTGSGSIGRKVAASSSSSWAPPAKRTADPLFLFVLTHLIGQNVEVQLKDGSNVTGVFSSATPDENGGGLGILLRMAQKKVGNEKVVVAGNGSVLMVTSRDMVQLICPGFHLMKPEDAEGQYLKSKSRHNVGIDSQLGSGHDMERKLQQWNPDMESSANLRLATDVNDSNSGSTSWDQFETNEKLFNVRSTYREELYTTKLDVNSPNYRENLAKADKIASEIMHKGRAGNTTNIHLLEERGLVIGDDSGIDEEQRYGAVIRTNNNASVVRKSPSPISSSSTTTSTSTSSPSRYVAPHRRGRKSPSPRTPVIEISRQCLEEETLKIDSVKVTNNPIQSSPPPQNRINATVVKSTTTTTQKPPEPPKPITQKPTTPTAASKLNPNAKIFKMTPNAKPFNPKSLTATAKPFVPRSSSMITPTKINVPEQQQPQQQQQARLPIRESESISSAEYLHEVYCLSRTQRQEYVREIPDQTPPFWQGPVTSYRYVDEELINKGIQQLSANPVAFHTTPRKYGVGVPYGGQQAFYESNMYKQSQPSHQVPPQYYAAASGPGPSTVYAPTVVQNHLPHQAPISPQHQP